MQIEKNPDQNGEVSAAGRGPAAGKKPYERPQIVYRAPLEAMAAVCMPAPPGKSLGDGSCSNQFS